MVAIPSDVVAAGENPSRFFFWMTVVMAGMIFFGFGLSYLVPMVDGSSAKLAPVVHIHGIFYFLWMLWLIMQSGLIQQRNIALHRSMGMLGIAIASGVLILGTAVSAMFVNKAADDPTIYGVTYISVVAIVGFALLFFLAIRAIHDKESHKRYILLATMVFLIGGLNRIFLALFGIGFESHATYLPKYLLVDVLIAAIVVYDWKSLGRIHNATIIGAAVNIVPQILHVPIVESAAFVSVTHWLGSIAYY